MKNGYIPEPYGQVVAEKHLQLRNAQRVPIGTLCDPATKEPILNRRARRHRLKFIQIDVSTSGDNIIIPALAGVKQIYEMVLWNVGAQTLQWQQGSTGNHPIRLLRLTNYPALTGLSLGFNGSFDQPHWSIDNGQALVLTLAANTQVDGFIRYTVED